MIGISILLVGVLIFILIEYCVFKGHTRKTHPDSTLVKPVVQP